MNKTLVCWIGHTDFRCASGMEDGLGPIGQAAKQHDYSAIELIANEPAKSVATFRLEVANYVKWLKTLTSSPVSVHQVKLSSPMHFGEVFEAADAVVAQILASGQKPLVFHLSPGTPAMMAMWLVLATTKYPAELIASSKEQGVYTPEFPFEIAADYLPRKRAATKGSIVQAAFDERTAPAFNKIVHSCEAMKLLIARAQRVAQFDVPVLILGETGTGKELFAEAIHNASPRLNGPFVAVNCGAIPKELVEAELFGYVKGAFTGADAARVGLIEQAHLGTLFLDELGELPLDVQVKLLRALQTGEVRPIGSKDARMLDIRVISATHRDLEKAISEQRFREDLYHRLAVGILMLPPLRQRPGDLQLLVDSRLNQLKSALVKGSDSVIPKLSPGARTLLNQQPWSGNIRELFNALTRAVIWCEGETIEKHDMQSALSSFSAGNVKCPVLDRPFTEGFSIEELLEDVEKHFIRRALKESPSRAAASRLLGYESPQTMRNRQVILQILDEK
jgi:DNA-binding NtrC family response regulator